MCFWKTPCNQVKKIGLSLQFKLGLHITEAYDIKIMLEDYLVDSADLGIEGETKCYAPIFVSDPGQR